MLVFASDAAKDDRYYNRTLGELDELSLVRNRIGFPSARKHPDLDEEGSENEEEDMEDEEGEEKEEEKVAENVDSRLSVGTRSADSPPRTADQSKAAALAMDWGLGDDANSNNDYLSSPRSRPDALAEEDASETDDDHQHSDDNDWESAASSGVSESTGQA